VNECDPEGGGIDVSLLSTSVPSLGPSEKCAAAPASLKIASQDLLVYEQYCSLKIIFMESCCGEQEDCRWRGGLRDFHQEAGLRTT